LAAVAVPAPLVAQVVADSGVFIVRRAGDTVAVERFVRTESSLTGTLDLWNPRRTSAGYLATVAPDATLPLIEVTVREDRDGGRVEGQVVQRTRVIFRDDSVAVDDMTKSGLETRILPTGRGAVPYLNLSFALLEQAVRRSKAEGGSEISFFNLGGGQTAAAKVASLGRDSLSVAIGTVEFHLRVDSSDRVLGGRIPAQDVVVERIGGS
jgi:hypothetical protein